MRNFRKGSRRRFLRVRSGHLVERHDGNLLGLGRAKQLHFLTFFVVGGNVSEIVQQVISRLFIHVRLLFHGESGRLRRRVKIGFFDDDDLRFIRVFRRFLLLLLAGRMIGARFVDARDFQRRFAVKIDLLDRQRRKFRRGRSSLIRLYRNNLKSRRTLGRYLGLSVR